MNGLCSIRWVATFVVATASSLAAQSSSGSRQSDSSSSFHVRAGGGVDLNWHHVTTANGLLGVDWQRPGSRFAVRWELNYARRDQAYDRWLSSFPTACTTYCVKSRVTQLAGTSLDGRVDLTRSRLRPYLVSGIGVFNVTNDDEANIRCTEGGQCVSTPGQFYTWRTSSLTLGLHAGAGLSWQVGRRQLFAETRLRSLLDAPYLSWHAPLAVGIRF